MIKVFYGVTVKSGSINLNELTEIPTTGAKVVFKGDNRTVLGSVMIAVMNKLIKRLQNSRLGMRFNDHSGYHGWMLACEVSEEVDDNELTSYIENYFEYDHSEISTLTFDELI